jgi:hypothetical protein
MSQGHTGAVPSPGHYTASTRTKTIYSVLIFAGLLMVSLGMFKDSERSWHAFLTSFFYFTLLALGGMFFTAIQHATNAGWSVTIRRFSESMTSFLPIAFVASIVLLLGAKQLYIWLDPEIVSHDKLLQGKSAYLNMTAFVVRLVLFFSLWLFFKAKIIGQSIKQDTDGNEIWTVKNAAYSIAFLLVFALSFSLFSVDQVMSLQPHWYSTIWGVYCFAGLFQSSIAALIIITISVMSTGLVRGLVTDEHLHDLGKFMKAFTVFYAYIGFSQFLLIWYANLPEETIFYLARSSGGWMTATLSLFVFKFAVPFLLLLPRAAKRSHVHLVLVATLILFMQYIDIHWMIYPTYSDTWILGWQEIGPFLLFGGLFLWSVTNFLNKNHLVPIRDPRIDEALHHRVTY